MNPVLLGTLYLLLYFAIAATTALVCHYLFPIPKELFRKILHFILLGSFLVFIFAYPTWQSAALASLYAWGIGDAFAALIGKKFGKHKINPGCGTCCRRYRTLFQKRQRHHHLSVICHGCLITTGLLIWRFII